jgi:hypothetical protein
MDEHPGPRRNARNTPQASPLKKPEQNRLGLVVPRMGRGDACCSGREHRRAKKPNPQFPGRFFSAEMVFGCMRAHVSAPRFAPHVQRTCQFPHECLVRITLRTTELMVEMRTNQVETTGFPQ